MKSVSLPVKSIDGSDKGTEELTLKVAEESARGLVHRYLVMVQQNARRVRIMLSDRAIRGQGKAAMQSLIPSMAALAFSLLSQYDYRIFYCRGLQAA